MGSRKNTMTRPNVRERASALADLDRAVRDAAAFFAQVDEALADEHQTAREVLAHFVFWHREYGRIVRALAKGRAPNLREGKFREFNAQATREFVTAPLPVLTQRLQDSQKRLQRALVALPDWDVNFPIKTGTKFTRVAIRVPQITAHIRNHVTRLQRAAKSKTRRDLDTLRV
jgi:hypothetical protein